MYNDPDTVSKTHSGKHLDARENKFNLHNNINLTDSPKRLTKLNKPSSTCIDVRL